MSYIQYRDALASQARAHEGSYAPVSNGALEGDHWVITPEDRIGPRPRRRWRAKLLLVTIVAAISGGLGWMSATDRAWLIETAKDMTVAVWAYATTPKTSVAQQPASQPSDSLPLPTQRELQEARIGLEPRAAVPADPPADSRVAAPPSSAPAAPSIANSTSRPAEADERPDPLPPPRVDRSNPQQVKAAASGLHPGLSRAVLETLTETDYRNADYAIHTAIAGTPDGDFFVWPKQHGPDMARFHVKFVTSAARDCRRYVVTVTKFGWSATALPMESCGHRLQAAKGSTGTQPAKRLTP